MISTWNNVYNLSCTETNKDRRCQIIEMVEYKMVAIFKMATNSQEKSIIF